MNRCITGASHCLNSLWQMGTPRLLSWPSLPLDRASALRLATHGYSGQTVILSLWHLEQIFPQNNSVSCNGCYPHSLYWLLLLSCLAEVHIWKETTFLLISFLNHWHAFQTISSSRRWIWVSLPFLPGYLPLKERLFYMHMALKCSTDTSVMIISCTQGSVFAWVTGTNECN